MPDSSRARGSAPTSRTHCRMATLVATLMVASACSARRPVDNNAPQPDRSRQAASALDVSRLYRDAGLIVETAPVPFVGTTAVFASETPDTTLVLVTLSLPNRALTFVHEGDHYRGAYDVIVDA